MRKDKKSGLDEMKASQQGSFPGNVSIPEGDFELLRLEVKRLLGQDARAKAKIESLCKTPETFSNSLGNIYSYLKDREICRACSEGILSCPKKRGGFSCEIAFDESRDEISLSLKPCPYQREKEQVFSRISPMDIPADDIYRQAVQFLQLVQERPEMKDVQIAYGDILLASENPGKDFRGLVFVPVGNDVLPEMALSFGAYFFARSGIQTAYLDLKDLLSAFRVLKDPSELEAARQDWVSAGTVPALFIRNIDLLPRLSLQEAENYLFPLLQARNREGRVTFSNAKDKNFFRVYRKIFYDSEYLDAALKDVEAIGKTLTIRDILL